MSVTCRIIITHKGTEAEWRVAARVIMSQILRGSTKGRDIGGSWTYGIEINKEDRAMSDNEPADGRHIWGEEN
jgi:hypothetical protein